MLHAFVPSTFRFLATGGRVALPLLPLLGALACAGPQPAVPQAASPRHVILITAQGLRPDAIGQAGPTGSSLTPHLDALIAGASASGTAISASPDTAPALASAVTGLSPWQHQVLHSASPAPARHLYTVAESFRDRGFATTAVPSGRILRTNPGYLQGFQQIVGLQRTAVVRRHLAELSEDPSFTWIHFDQPQPPYFRSQADRNPRRRRALLAEIERYRNPATVLPTAQRERLWQGYLRNVSRLDRELGSLLEALRSSGRWDEAMIVFVSLHGEEFGEHGQVGHGNNLGRATLEVPWALKIPSSMDPGLLHIPLRPGLTRLISTLVAATGSGPAPALDRSLFEGGDAGALSELYLTNGVNHFSLIQGDLQMVRSVTFTRPERRYYLARRQLLRDPRVGGDPTSAEAVFRRLEESFERSRPFTAPPAAVETDLLRWPDTDSGPVEDPRAQARLSAALERRWSFFLDSERPPAEERRFRRGGPP